MSSKSANLVIRAQNGDTEAFGELYSLYCDDMYRFAYYYTGESYAADAVSDAALEAFKNIKSLKKADSFKSWMFKILFVSCVKAQKQKAQNSLNCPLENASNIHAIVPEHFENLELQKGLEQLSQEEREIIVLTFACGYKSDEVASMLELRPSTVRSKLSRAVSKLRRYINQ